jgi:hypothetical protein
LLRCVPEQPARFHQACCGARAAQRSGEDTMSIRLSLRDVRTVRAVLDMICWDGKVTNLVNLNPPIYEAICRDAAAARERTLLALAAVNSIPSTIPLSKQR